MYSKNYLYNLLVHRSTMYNVNNRSNLFCIPQNRKCIWVQNCLINNPLVMILNLKLTCILKVKDSLGPFVYVIFNNFIYNKLIIPSFYTFMEWDLATKNPSGRYMHFPCQT